MNTCMLLASKVFGQFDWFGGRAKATGSVGFCRSGTRWRSSCGWAMGVGCVTVSVSVSVTVANSVFIMLCHVSHGWLTRPSIAHVFGEMGGD